jgi:cytidine deaminase
VAIDWPALRQTATTVAATAYAPYSGLRVGAAGLTATGQVIVGCNVENASYGLTLCAECGLVTALHAQASPSQASPSQASPSQASPSRASSSQASPGQTPTLVAVAVVAGDGAPLLPCGRCRQLLLEAGGPDLLVDTDNGPVSLGALLPAAFDTTELKARREPAQ